MLNSENMFSHHNKIKLEINNNNLSGKYQILENYIT